MLVNLVINNAWLMHVLNSINFCGAITRKTLKKTCIWWSAKLIVCLFRIPVNLKQVVYCSVVSEGADKEWDFLFEKFEKENVAAEQVTILNALGCTKKSHLIKVSINITIFQKKKCNTIFILKTFRNILQTFYLIKFDCKTSTRLSWQHYRNKSILI